MSILKPDLLNGLMSHFIAVHYRQSTYNQLVVTTVYVLIVVFYFSLRKQLNTHLVHVINQNNTLQFVMQHVVS